MLITKHISVRIMFRIDEAEQALDNASALEAQGLHIVGVVQPKGPRQFGYIDLVAGAVERTLTDNLTKALRM